MICSHHNDIEYPKHPKQSTKQPKAFSKQQTMCSFNNEQKWSETITGTYLSKYVRNEQGQKLSYDTFEEAKTAATRIGDVCGGITLEKGGKSGPKYTLRKGKVAMIHYREDQHTYGLASWIKK